MNEIPINLAVAGFLTGVLNGIGAVLKANPRVQNDYIPTVLCLRGSVAYPMVEGWSAIHAMIGLWVALSAVGVHQSFRQVASLTQRSGPVLVFLSTGLISTLLLAFLVGCATSPAITGPERVQRSVDAAVGIFATVKLQEHPQSRPQFEAARRGLDALVSSERWDLAAFGESLAATGAAQISGADIVLIVQTSVVLIDAVTGQDVDLSRVEYARAVIVGGHRALTRVLSRP